MISSKHLEAIPAPDQLKFVSQSIAMLDALLMPTWVYRYYSFNDSWADQCALASMQNGSGDSYIILFAPEGTLIKGYGHESPMATPVAEHGQPWPGVLKGVSSKMMERLRDPALSIEETTFCLWQRSLETQWNIGPISFPEGDDPDGSAGLLFMLDGDPRTYQTWAQEYYTRDVELGLVEHIYQHKPITNTLLARYGVDVDASRLETEIQEIGYQ